MRLYERSDSVHARHSFMQRATTVFDEVFTNYGLYINVSKTESMSLNSTEFKHIDSFISQNKPNMGDIEINHHIQMAYAKFATMTNLIQNSKIHQTQGSE